MDIRPTPYDLVFAEVADERFTPIRTALAERQTASTDRDAFLMSRDVVTLIRDLRPEDGMGEGIEQLAALVHHAYLFWDAGMPVVTVPSAALPDLLDAREGGTTNPATNRAPAEYFQLPERRVWAAVIPDEPAEPLDGYFVHAVGPELRVLGVFGIRPDRMGFSVVEAAGARQSNLARPDGSAIFSSQLPGGEAAGLHSLVGAEELLELGWRAWTA